jgi:hypothetical protein
MQRMINSDKECRIILKPPTHHPAMSVIQLQLCCPDALKAGCHSRLCNIGPVYCRPLNAALVHMPQQLQATLTTVSEQACCFYDG